MSEGRGFTASEPTELLELLLEKMPNKGRNKVKGLLTHRQIEIDGKVVTRHDYVVQPGQRVMLTDVKGPTKDVLQGLRILYEDQDLLVVDKPPGLLSVATEEEREHTAYFALTDYVRHFDPANRIFVVHRLDRETSGVMMFAKREDIQQALQNAWKDSVKERTYVVLVEGHVSQAEGQITSWLQESKTKTMYVGKPGVGQKAVLHYKVLQAGPVYSMLEVRLDTGRKNQIRVQLQHAGHSVVGDKRYGAKRNPLGRLGLHARVLAFVHPVTGEMLRFETPIPPSFKRLFGTVKKNPK